MGRHRLSRILAAYLEHGLITETPSTYTGRHRAA